MTRNVLITGASTGIGRALALEYASRGAHVAVAARRKDLLEGLVGEIAAGGGKALALPVDVGDTVAAREVVLRAERDLGGLDMVIANAGVGTAKHAAVLEWNDVEDVFRVNVFGAIATLMAAIPIMLHQKSGHLVGVSSLAGRRGLPRSGVYGASKAALSSFLETARVDLGSAGIRVTDVQPGFVATPMTENNKHPMPFKWSPEKAAKVIARRLERAPSVVAFPWQLDWLLRATRIMPTWLFDVTLRGVEG